jgi:hypothetical protein
MAATVGAPVPESNAPTQVFAPIEPTVPIATSAPTINAAATVASPAAPSSTNSNTLQVVPIAGFVIKTRCSLEEDVRKVFINVFHSPAVVDADLLLLASTGPAPTAAQLAAVAQAERDRAPGLGPGLGPVTGSSSKNYTPVKAAFSAAAASSAPTSPDAAASAAAESTTFVPVVFVGEANSVAEDKEGTASLVYSVLVSSEYFDPERCQLVAQQQQQGKLGDVPSTVMHSTCVNKVRVKAMFMF